MGRRIIAVLIAMGLVMTTLTGCVKVVKIGEEGNLTGEVEFSASDNVGSFWETQALPELTGKAVDLGEFLKEANGDLGSLADKYGKYSMGDSGELTYTVKGTEQLQKYRQKKKPVILQSSSMDMMEAKKSRFRWARL